MKGLTIHHPKLGSFFVQISPHISHKDFLKELGDPKYSDAGFCTLPDGVSPRYVGHSISLDSAPSQIGRKLLESGYEITRAQYPFAPLFHTFPGCS